MKLIERTDYLERLSDVRGTPDIKVITGIRRCGKSKLMESFIDLLLKEDKNANIIHINFNDDEFEKYAEYHAFLEYVKSKYKNFLQKAMFEFMILDVA